MVLLGAAAAFGSGLWTAMPVFERHRRCTQGSVCLWPEPNYEGRMWKWTPGVDKDGPLPAYLRNHVGSFDSQAESLCFADTDGVPEQPIPVLARDFGWDYNTRFGAKMDGIRTWCPEILQRPEMSASPAPAKASS